MDEQCAHKPFERYADDIVIHCSSKREAEGILEKLKARMLEFELTLHPEKTKIVYCKDYRRTENHDNERFTFLSYSFEPRCTTLSKSKQRLVFSPAISQMAKVHIRTKIGEALYHRRSIQTLERTAERLNPKIRGWINYYTRYHRDKAYGVFLYLNVLIRKWIQTKYKIRSRVKAYKEYIKIRKASPKLFYHWKLGIIF